MAPYSPGKSHGRRSLVGCRPWGCEESDTTEQLHFHFSLSCIGEGNGNPLQCSCLENPMDEGTWRASVYGISQSRTLLKQLQQQQPFSSPGDLFNAGIELGYSALQLDSVPTGLSGKLSIFLFLQLNAIILS